MHPFSVIVFYYRWIEDFPKGRFRRAIRKAGGGGGGGGGRCWPLQARYEKRGVGCYPLQARYEKRRGVLSASIRPDTKSGGGVQARYGSGGGGGGGGGVA